MLKPNLALLVLTDGLRECRYKKPFRQRVDGRILDISGNLFSMPDVARAWRTASPGVGQSWGMPSLLAWRPSLLRGGPTNMFLVIPGTAS